MVMATPRIELDEHGRLINPATPYRLEYDAHGRILPPEEVLRAALRRRPRPAPAPPRSSREATPAQSVAVAKPKAPSWATPPWWHREFLHHRSVEIGVGAERATVAAAARLEACRALHISKYELPPLRFSSRPPVGAPDDLPAWFEQSLSGGTVCVVARQSLLMTAVCVVHETCHFHQARKLGGLVDIARETGNNPSHPLEREARSAHQDFEEYLKRAWIYNTAIAEPRLLYWAKQVLYGKPRAEWTAPGWMKNDG
jgi:hypothetical protein